MVLAANPPETLQIQWFGAQLALKPYKYNGFGQGRSETLQL